MRNPVVPSKSKSATRLQKAVEAILVELNRYGRKVVCYTTDDERTLATLRDAQGRLGIQVTSTPAGLHEKQIERHIHTIIDRRNAMLAGLSYEWPDSLEYESYIDAITWINCVPNSQVGYTTPYQLITGQKPFLPRYHFGQVGLFYSPHEKISILIFAANREFSSGMALRLIICARICPCASTCTLSASSPRILLSRLNLV